ncbi:MAG: hypothetical protein KI791_14330 [Cyclobacteriaceae bacterium]|nr:hypothetical protein [Cyclobacteriaceae bacterium SS2]
MRLLSILILLVLVTDLVAQDTKVPSKDWQLKTAVLALPEANRDQATVLGYDQTGELITLRKGTNEFICLGDDPGKEGFSVAAYHKELEPYMARGRELRKQGKDAGEIFDIREEEVKSGKLQMPDKSTLYVANGEVDASGEVQNLKVRFVVYIPYATAESTGLSPAPIGPGAPWIMNPGTHRAHIMITPE